VGQLREAARAVRHKPAFLGGLGWTSTLFMVMASARLGAALAQVLVVTGELVTACAVDEATEARREGRCATLGCLGLALAGVALNVADEAHQEASGAGSGSSLGLLPVVALAFGCGACLVLNSLGNTHLRHQLGALNASAASAFVASVGNAAIWAAAELAGWAHFKSDARASTVFLWGVVGLSSSWMVFVVTFIPHRIGFAMTFCLIVAGKASGGLVADALALAGRQRPITLRRGVGVAAVFLGAALQKLCKPEPVPPSEEADPGPGDGQRRYDVLGGSTEPARATARPGGGYPPDPRPRAEQGLRTVVGCSADPAGKEALELSASERAPEMPTAHRARLA